MVRSVYYFRGVPQLASLVEMIMQILVDMTAFMAIVTLLIVAFGLSAFVLHSTHPDDVDGSFSTISEALFTTVSQNIAAFAHFFSVLTRPSG